jgi:hypothetical protein
MKAFFSSLFILPVLVVSAQNQKQKKNYEYEDTRKKNESFAKLPKDQVRSDLATFTLSGVDESVAREDFPKIPFTSFDANHMTFEGDDIRAIVTTEKYDTAKHRFDYDEGYLIKIDRKTYYGGYGNLPKSHIKNIKMVVGKDSVQIPSVAYSDLYNLNLTYKEKGVERSRNGIFRSKDGHRIYLYLFCKDANGSYEVTFIIQDKRYVKRVLDYGIL